MDSKIVGIYRIGNIARFCYSLGAAQSTIFITIDGALRMDRCDEILLITPIQSKYLQTHRFGVKNILFE